MAKQTRKAQLQAFLLTIDPHRLDRARQIAWLFVHSDRRFIGLDRVRDEIAETAALNALGGKFECKLMHQKSVAGTQADAEFRAFLAATTAHIKAQIETT